ncbi:auxin efflux carrier [Paenibacillus terrae HPL-003]|uniref:Auxin efflux carrier n=1 Tax=Paenibacillus terrae (strain HPL-003) TaxID=985665 RepID=G7VWC1_PAETH|nr:AEC family transporter [Paenibacillus terrae]AET59322.1 auxin efflux carrier [Paenibacillus terrae HPL-003]
MLEILIHENMILLTYMVIGFLAFRLKLLHTSHMEGLSRVLLGISLPSAILYSLQIPLSRELLRDIGITLIVAVAILFSTLAIGRLSARLLGVKTGEREVWVGCCIFSSILFIGMPIVEAMYGERGLAILVTYNAVYNVALFSMGVRIFSAGKASTVSLAGLLRNPAIIATAAGFGMFLLNVRLPAPLLDASKSLGGLTVPIAMIITGSMIAGSKLGSLLRNKRVYLFSLVRQVVVPVVLLVMFKSIMEGGVLLGIAFLVSAMPSGASNSAFAETYGGRGGEASQYVVMSTLISIFTIPLLFLLV